MSLLIDIGNTRIKIGYAGSDGRRQQQHTLALPHQQIEAILPWLEEHGLRPTRALGISVASKALMYQLEGLLQHIQCNMSWLDATTPCPLLHNNYEQPDRLGADRWLAMIGVLAQQHQHRSRPIVHVSFGTATTIDTIMPATTCAAQFIGGLILPGPQLMYDSLADNTAQLGNGLGNITAFPLATRSAISSGVAAAQSGAVLRQWQLAWQQHRGTPLLVCSGGGWDLIQEEIQNAYQQQLQLLHLAVEPVIWQPMPVLDGLAYMTTSFRNP
ncbi:type III pantothenate kinase [Paenalcaligenes sp.]|uniref:type III pantothenate kinase n=1 Tax=Paenalcaligenes sp. TaxID=1966342 RepID=UPI0021B14248|nr:type III pantothenate kinase [Paenalcaligenes sp.]